VRRQRNGGEVIRQSNIVKAISGKQQRQSSNGKVAMAKQQWQSNIGKAATAKQQQVACGLIIREA
jgi:hypothetical protein